MLSYLVSQRRREIGIRLAIGAAPQAVARMVLGRGLLLAGTGVALGVGTSVLLGRVIAVLLYDVAPTDPRSFAAGAAVLLVVALVASYLPARRATRIDPVTALRTD